MKNWRLAPPRANYWAQDQSGLAVWFEEEPLCKYEKDGTQAWDSEGWQECDYTESWSEGNPNSADSLERRPQPIIGMRWVERQLSRQMMYQGEVVYAESSETAKILQQQTEDGEWSDVPTITE